MAKVILFDFWGTLVENGVYPSPLKQAKFILWVEGPYSYFVQMFEKHFMTSKFNDLTQGFKHACDELKLQYQDDQIEKLVGMWNKNRLLAKVFPETEEVLKALKAKGYKIVLISNTDFSSIDGLLDKFNLRQYFDATVLSYDCGLLKNEPRMFEIALEKVGASKDDALMVGDSFESDVKGAQKAGIKAVLLDRHDRVQHSPKILTLLEMEDFLNHIKF